MHRVGRSAPALPCTAAHAVRLYSTPPPKPRTPLGKWGDLVIPTRQEVIALREKRATTDINYLKFENEKSLAARLARPTIDITLARKQALKNDAQPQAQTPVPEVTEAVAEAPSEEAESSAPPVNAFEYMITQRREARFIRENERLAQKQRVEAERAQYEELRLAREARRKQIEQEKRAKAHSAINDFQPLSEQLSLPKKSADPQAEQRREYIAKLASDLAEKRRLERQEREKEEMESGQMTKKDRRQSSFSSRRPTSSMLQKEDEDFEIQLSEERSEYEDFEPQLLPPTPLADVLTRGWHKSVSERIEEGVYSRYVALSPEVFGTTPDELGASDVAEVALSHRRDVSLPQRRQSLVLINRALDRKSKPRAAP